MYATTLASDLKIVGGKSRKWMFWQKVTNGAIQINMWGGAFAPNTKEPPTPLSVEVVPVSNRASWFQPPYQ